MIDLVDIICNAIECINNENRKCKRYTILLESNGEYDQPECKYYETKD